MTKLTQKKVKEAIKDSYGNIALISERCQVTRRRMYDYLKQYPAYNQLVMDERERTIDVVEGKLLNIINKEDFQAIKFFLSTKGKERGYVTRTEQVVDSDVDAKISLSGLSQDETDKLLSLVRDNKED